jgi:hypothetical protein
VDRSGPYGVGRADISLVGQPARRGPAMTVVVAITAIILTIAAALSVAARAAASESSTTQAVPAATPSRVRRRAMRNSGVSRPIALIRPQYLPALARSRVLRLRMLRTR